MIDRVYVQYICVYLVVTAWICVTCLEQQHDSTSKLWFCNYTSFALSFFSTWHLQKATYINHLVEEGSNQIHGRASSSRMSWDHYVLVHSFRTMTFQLYLLVFLVGLYPFYLDWSNIIYFCTFSLSLQEIFTHCFCSCLINYKRLWEVLILFLQLNLCLYL